LKTIHHVVDIDTAAGPIWSALTEVDRMAAWWSTKVETPVAAVGARVQWTFAGDFNPAMEVTGLDEPTLLEWRCIGGHDPWHNSTFRFELASMDESRTRLRFTQGYGGELGDDAYGIYNFNWGYYLESLRLLCTTGIGKPYQA